ncbi:hypothetical protein CLAIMM_13708 [Cladophialophora immunda]|nr:hypothetical protein CLAIMM_13708 [Cladophialophora immunda]
MLHFSGSIPTSPSGRKCSAVWSSQSTVLVHHWKHKKQNSLKRPAASGAGFLTVVDVKPPCRKPVPIFESVVARMFHLTEKSPAPELAATVTVGGRAVQVRTVCLCLYRLHQLNQVTHDLDPDFITKTSLNKFSAKRSRSGIIFLVCTKSDSKG